MSIALSTAGPSPRCVTVSAERRLRVLNQIGESTITVNWAGYPPRPVPAGTAIVYDRPFGQYLAPGVHALHVSRPQSSVPEVWLRGKIWRMPRSVHHPVRR